MRGYLAQEIRLALDQAPAAPPQIHTGTDAALPSVYDVACLAASSIGAAAAELAALLSSQPFSGPENRAAEPVKALVDRRLSQLWFGFTLRPQGWEVGSAWDPIAGDYLASDGWIRLHTNAPHHRAAALRVLGLPPEAANREAVTAAVKAWSAGALHEAVVTAGGCAAMMLSSAAWAAHPQGKMVAAEPLIAWQQVGEAGPVAMQGLKVLDLTRVLAGPVATRFLAGFGAKVLRIDPPGWEEPGVEAEVTLGKSCAGLDLTNSADHQTFADLLSRADVLVHGYRPGALEALGFGDAARRALNPALTDVALCAWGWSGPWAGRRGFDSLVQMSTGIAHTGMERAGAVKPVPLPVQALDHATGYLMAAAVIHALRARSADGRVLQARLSLARTGLLLTSAPVPEDRPALPKLEEADFGAAIEATDWGPAQRVRAPVILGGTGPAWPRPATRFRSSPAAW